MAQQSDQQLYWPPGSSTNIWSGWVCIVLGILFSCAIIPLAFIPVGILAIRQGKNALQWRKFTIDTTHSVLMSKVEYVGGHPLIPHAGTAVLGLSTDQLTIYSLSGNYAIQLLASIPLGDVVQAGMGRPKTAREVYDEDYGHTIDVYEHSPFLSVIFKLGEDTYRVSFQSFESQTPQEWYNQITALRYQLQETRRQEGWSRAV